MSRTRTLMTWLLAVTGVVGVVAVADAQDPQPPGPVDIDGPAQVDLGQDVAYRVLLRSASRPAKDVTLRVQVAGPPAAALTTGEGACQASGTVVDCRWGNLPPNAQRAVDIALRPGSAGALVVNATVLATVDRVPVTWSTVRTTQVRRPDDPEPEKSPTAGPTETPTPTPPSGPGPTPTPTQEVGGERAGTPLLTPVPIVRIAGELTRRGARIKRLTVLTPPRVRITVRCEGRRCPYQRRRMTVARAGGRMVTVRVRRAERRYRAGSRLVVAVERRGYIGKVTRYSIRRGKAPGRADGCIAFGARRTRPCSGA